MEGTYQLKVEAWLHSWVIWRYQQSGEVKGFPREVPFYRMMRGASVSAPAVDDAIGERVDGAVSSLCQNYPDEGTAIKLRYLEGMSHKTIGRALRVSETRARELQRQGERYVEGCLNSY